ncbi:RNA-binding protein Nova-1 isoform X4 [Nilaparvata lugens]|uniref:RNA-binding protein Nova-1 isoform X4 n=1 Tax=Nilaparvata lugens TaxID=108931 RepID=UPI00193E02CD|nr:RNA-binding protein Nova-1 isoform X4 [Nilaparvata lugens]
MAADSGIDTCPSPENPDSRKRPLDGDIENGTIKRSHYAEDDAMFRGSLLAALNGIGDDDLTVYHFKILVPNVASGAIIGKGGETIAQLQKDTKAKVKMSKANDFYPGTTERVCLISGSMMSIMAVLMFIMEKIREKPEPGGGGSGGGGKQSSPDMDVKVKILIPNTTAGMIIGKGGAYIKQIKEQSGSHVQISQKAKDQSLQERCITVLGDVDSNSKACSMILTKVMEDPHSGSCLNVSYADIAGPVANYNPTGSPYAHNTAAVGASSFAANSNLSNMSQMMLNGGGGGLGQGGLNLSLNLNSPFVGTNQSLTSQLIDNIKIMLHSRGYSEHATNEISSAMSTLAKYGILGMGLGLGQTSGSSLLSGGFLGMSPMDATPAQANGLAASSGVFGPIGTNPGGRGSLDVPPFDPFRHQAGLAATPGAINNNSFGLGASRGGGGGSGANKEDSDVKETKKVDLNVPEMIVGAILGPGGRSLVEIQLLSGANIQISKKGIYAPGTRNRVVTISGSVNAISTAQYLIEQRISEEETKRRQATLSIIQ